MKINNTQLTISAVRRSQYPTDNLPEFLLVGRSNVGKSSFINTIINRKNYARTSANPGKTQTINFYLINEAFYLVDAPGYGYAKTSILNDKSFANMMEEYIFDRDNIKLFVLLVDSRRVLSSDDISCLKLLMRTNKDIVVVGTKADKLNQSAKSKFKKNVIDVINTKVYLTSITNKNSLNELIELIDKTGRQN